MKLTFRGSVVDLMFWVLLLLVCVGRACLGQSVFPPAAGGSAGTAEPSVSTSVTAGTGAGTSPSVAVNGNQRHGTIFVNSGTGPVSGSVVVTVAFNQTLSSTPTCSVYPASPSAAALSKTEQVYTTSESTTSFAVTSGASALLSSVLYSWKYTCVR